MILKLNASHQNKLEKFLMEEKELNLFIIGDLENFGFNEEFIEYWGEFNENNEIIAVLLRFYDDFTVYSKGEFDALGFSKILKDYNFSLLSGKMSVVEKFSHHIKVYGKRGMYFAKLDKLDKLYSGVLLEVIQPTLQEDVVKLYELYTIIDGREDIETLGRLKSKFSSKGGRGYHIKNHKGEMVCSAETTAENKHSAMVVGVCTNPNYRNKGYATAVVSKLCKDLLLEGRTLCLFYDNPAAGKIYKNLGFEDIGFWSLWEGKEGK